LSAKTLEIGDATKRANALAANTLRVNVIYLSTSLFIIHREIGGEIGGSLGSSKSVAKGEKRLNSGVLT
jgi:hypothetical protein